MFGYGESIPMKETACTAVSTAVHERLKAELPEILGGTSLNSSFRTAGKDTAYLSYELLIDSEITPLYDTLWLSMKEYIANVFKESQAKLLEQFPTAELLEVTFDDTERTIMIRQRPVS